MRPRTRVTILIGLASLWTGMAVRAGAADPAGVEFFESKVRPILSENCFECHGPTKQKSGLRLDHISTILKGGERGPEIVPGDLKASRLVEAVRYENPDLQMPPKKKLRAEQVAVLEEWVRRGAPWPDEPAPGEAVRKDNAFDIQHRKAEHWAWRPIAKPQAGASIDALVLAKLKREGLKPARPAERATWLRRVYFDLIGLPPTSEQVERFLADRSGGAYENVVDEMLASPRFGERWARHWMDMVRYAETYGHEFDYPVEGAWRYRDYLIRAINADVPYDQLVREHLAGDLFTVSASNPLESPRTHPSEGYNESVIGTAFWLLHEQTHAPTDVRQHQADRVDNQIDVMSKAFLGLTVACARCHDHKFDAISTADYYALAGILRSSRQQTALLDPHGKIEADVRELADLRRRGDGLAGGSSEPRGVSERSDGVFESFDGPTFGDWRATGWAFGGGPTRASQWGSWLAPDRLAEPGVAHSGMLGERLSGALRSREFTITEPSIYIRLAGEKGQVRVIIDGYVMDTFNPLLFGGVTVNVNTGGKFIWHTITGDYSRYIGQSAHIEILDHGDGWVAVDRIVFGKAPPPEAAGVVAEPPAVPAERVEELKGLAEQVRRLNEQLPYPDRVLAMTDGTGEDGPIYIRGSHRTPGPVVPRRFLEAFGGPPRLGGEGQGSGRLELARAILDQENPFPARVAVNRIWHHLIGRGIVPTVDNFGVLGQGPSHPELLDYLASSFQENGWSQKAVIRQIVLSQTYRMSSVPADAAAEKADPTNTLLHRMNVKRLEGETIRDAVLAVSGRLDEKMFGPSVPVHLTEFMQGRGRPRESGPIDGAGRRSIYTEVRRNFLPPFMLAFDAPPPFTTFSQRTVSNVPAQSLILMNDPFITQQAGRWAQRALQRPSASADERIEWMYLVAYARRPSREEVAAAREFVERQAGMHETSADPTNSPAAWADLAHALLNVKEFIFIP